MHGTCAGRCAVVNLNSNVITLVLDERKLRGILRRSIRPGAAMSETEEQHIVDEFIRVTRTNGAPESAETGDDTKKQFDEVLHELCLAISVVKTVQVAIEGESELDWAVRDQTLEVAIERLDAAYTRIDLAIVRLGTAARS
jgi:hypothetical protein